MRCRRVASKRTTGFPLPQQPSSLSARQNLDMAPMTHQLALAYSVNDLADPTLSKAPYCARFYLEHPAAAVPLRNLMSDEDRAQSSRGVPYSLAAMFTSGVSPVLSLSIPHCFVFSVHV